MKEHFATYTFPSIKPPGSLLLSSNLPSPPPSFLSSFLRKTLRISEQESHYLLVRVLGFEGCVTLGQRLRLSEPRFPYLSNGDNGQAHFILYYEDEVKTWRKSLARLRARSKRGIIAASSCFCYRICFLPAGRTQRQLTRTASAPKGARSPERVTRLRKLVLKRGIIFPDRNTDVLTVL